MCDNANGPFAPFCAPANGSKLAAGSTHDVTWDPTFFGSSTSPLQVSGTFFTSSSNFSSSSSSSSSSSGFTTTVLGAGAGTFRWTVPEVHATDGSAAVLVALTLDVGDGTATTTQIPGPTVQIAPRRQGGGGPGVAAVVVPVLVAALVLAGVFAALAYRRRKKKQQQQTVPARTGAGGGGGGGGGGDYGIRERMARSGGAKVQIGSLEYSAGQFRPNVFREELRRQSGVEGIV
ncbi:hypothetical protein F4780DRAFT_494051 [Xylariomycetidae sp. FL0641]|nr:hypothetical protein F4780DRAFT_494051 [Xylariomycetidae sp. FL0641]